ncbi:MAG: site-specific integrase [Actinomycetota bacterium]|nr:site-specific integrase [Actinomycetota bacterium]
MSFGPRSSRAGPTEGGHHVHDHLYRRRPRRGSRRSDRGDGRRRVLGRIRRRHPHRYATDLRIFATWCRQADLGLLTVRRSHLELFGRCMEETGRMRSTVARRLSTLASFYRYCEQEQLVDRNPALNVRRPKVDYESRTLGLDRNELGAFLV